MRIDPATLAHLRRDLMRRGATLATLLAQKPGKRPEEVLRLALDQVEACRRLLDAGDDRYGRCGTCGTDLGVAALGEMPWADRCATHAVM